MWAFAIGQPTVGDYVYLASVTVGSRAPYTQARYAPYCDHNNVALLEGPLPHLGVIKRTAQGMGTVTRVRQSGLSTFVLTRKAHASIAAEITSPQPKAEACYPNLCETYRDTGSDLYRFALLTEVTAPQRIAPLIIALDALEHELLISRDSQGMPWSVAADRQIMRGEARAYSIGARYRALLAKRVPRSKPGVK